MRYTSALLCPGLILTAACASSEGTSLATATIDTLPGGVIEVRNPGPTRWPDTTGWHLVETLRIYGTGEPDGDLGQPRSVAEDDRGRIYESDWNPPTIKVWDHNGKFLKTIGREGEGPGEYRTAQLATFGSNLIVHDRRLARTTVFDSAGEYLRSWHSGCCSGQKIAVDRAGRIYIPTFSAMNVNANTIYLRYTIDGTLIDTLVPPPGPGREAWILRRGGGVMSRMIPFTPTQETIIDPGGGIISGFTGAYRLAVIPKGTDTTVLFGRDWTARQIPDSTREAVVEAAIQGAIKSWGEAEAREAFQVQDVPATAPAFVRIAVDGNRNRWVQTNVSDTTARFDVFDSTGIYLGPVRAPSDAGKGVWKSDHVITMTTDDEGLPVVIRYELVKEEETSQ